MHNYELNKFWRRLAQDDGILLYSDSYYRFWFDYDVDTLGPTWKYSMSMINPDY